MNEEEANAMMDRAKIIGQKIVDAIDGSGTEDTMLALLYLTAHVGVQHGQLNPDRPSFLAFAIKHLQNAQVLADAPDMEERHNHAHYH